MRKKLNPLLTRLFDAMAANRPPPPRFGIGWLKGVVGVVAGSPSCCG
jgi:hypothetical protein